MTKYYADRVTAYPCKRCGERVVVPRTEKSSDVKRDHEKICKVRTSN